MNLIGQRLGNYQLMRLLGDGGYAQVYLGEHTMLSMQAAIKVLHTPLSEREVERFCQEAQAVARLAHRNIVRLLEFDVAEGLPFLVMEYAPGGTLRQRHPEGEPLPLHLVLTYVEQIAAALAYTHGHQLIYRDLKPENVLFGQHDHLLLGDFGLAILAQSSSAFKPQEVAGTVAYMAPEQIQGRPCPASDQYALAILVYEWLTGKRPFTGSLMEVIAQQTVATPPRLRERMPTITPAVEAVVLRALTKDPKARFESCEAFASALAQAGRRMSLLTRSRETFAPAAGQAASKEPVGWLQSSIPVPPPEPPAEIRLRPEATAPRAIPGTTIRARPTQEREAMLTVISLAFIHGPRQSAPSEILVTKTRKHWESFILAALLVLVLLGSCLVLLRHP